MGDDKEETVKIAHVDGEVWNSLGTKALRTRHWVRTMAMACNSNPLSVLVELFATLLDDLETA